MKKWNKERFATIWEKLESMIALRSLRARIFLLTLVIGLVPCIAMRHGIVSNYEDLAVEQRTTVVQNQLMILANHLISNNYLSSHGVREDTGNSREVINAELEMLSNLYEGRVMIINKNFKVEKDTYGISEGKTIISEEVIKCFQGENISHYDPEHGYIEMTTPIMDTTANTTDENGKRNPDAIRGVMLTSISNDSIVNAKEVLNRKAYILEVIMMVAILALAIILSRALTRPFNRVTQAINAVKEGFSDETISVPDYVETVHIVDAFNQLLKRMKALDDSRQEFVANVSHELKTPMTSIKVLSDSLLAQENVPAELYREFMEDIASEIDRENQIITDLLALVKMDKKVQDLNIVSLNINDLTELILKRLRPIARKKDVEVVFESVRPVVAEVDEVKMTLIMTNLVENAIKYNKDHGWVKVILDADHQYFTFEVSDSGIGIPEEDLAHICERFYRVDKSHSREIGGTGLGLAITKSAVLMHKGSLTVTSTEGQGSCFLVKIPLTYIAS
ncbi:sensor histidine kinase [Waltera sp.]|uniref:sensor histidine kinase n=1 Tax=Waltera sp. TaxID=2815806 RepID=UPI003AB9ABD3